MLLKISTIGELMSFTDEIVQLLNDSPVYVWDKYKRTKEAAIAMGLDLKKSFILAWPWRACTHIWSDE